LEFKMSDIADEFRATLSELYRREEAARARDARVWQAEQARRGETAALLAEQRPEEERLERRIRRLADKEGYRLVKARGREYMLVEVWPHNLPVLGWDYDASLSEVEQWLKAEPKTEAR
jgi:hypothetical protein